MLKLLKLEGLGFFFPFFKEGQYHASQPVTDLTHSYATPAQSVCLMSKLLAVTKSSVTLTRYTTETLLQHPALGKISQSRSLLPGYQGDAGGLTPGVRYLGTAGNGKRAVTFCSELRAGETGTAKGNSPPPLSAAFEVRAF